MYEVGRDSRLTKSMCDVVTEIDGDGLEDSDESSDGSGSDSPTVPGTGDLEFIPKILKYILNIQI